MARRYEDWCVGCPAEMGCMGSSCPNRNVEIVYCDECGEDNETIYEFDGEELCLNCIEEKLVKVKEI